MAFQSSERTRIQVQSPSCATGYFASALRRTARSLRHRSSVYPVLQTKCWIGALCCGRGAGVPRGATANRINCAASEIDAASFTEHLLRCSVKLVHRPIYLNGLAVTLLSNLRHKLMR